jgi:flagellar biosynthesis/type III secretory pathway protein FliH
LTPTASVDILESFTDTLYAENWGQGIYFLKKGLKTVIIVIHQLPSTPETLFLRVLGRGKVQRQAVEELEALANNNPFFEDIIKLVNDLITLLSARNRKEQDIDQDDRELIMKLSEMYQQLVEEIKQEGRQEGLQEGLQEGEQKGRQEGRQEGELLGINRGIETERRAMVESILQVRFGEIDSQLATIIDQVIAMTREEFTPMLLQLSREELLVKFTP